MAIAVGLTYACAAPPEEAPSHPRHPEVDRAALVHPQNPMAVAPDPSSARFESRAPTLARPAACSAPSLSAGGPLDARDMAGLGACERLPPLVGGTDSRRCGAVPVMDGARSLDRFVLPIDPITRARIRAVRALGREKGRRARVFGLVGDSITAGELFMGPFSHSSPQGFTLAPWALERLSVARSDGSSSTIIDFYRGVEAEPQPGFFRDSFRATRAARTGAPSAWALASDPSGVSPVDRLIDQLSPAVALVMFGSNDAVARVAPAHELAAQFRESLGRVVDRLESEGVVVVLWTIPRRGPQPELETCGREGARTNARLMVQTNAISAAAAELACERSLPLVDMRAAFDHLVSHGLFSDGVHPSSFGAGSGQLTEEGLRCGYNARNYLALRALRQVHESLGLQNEEMESTSGVGSAERPQDHRR